MVVALMAFKMWGRNTDPVTGHPVHKQGPYERPAEPHHIHLDPDCTNQLECGDDHWQGGRPQPDWPHHVEVDHSTGRVAYTRHTPEEKADYEKADAFLNEQLEKAQAAVTARYDIIRGRAKDDPAFRAIAEHLGIQLD